MKIVINPAYQQLSSFVESIPDIFEKEGTIIYEGRNQLKIYQVDGYDIVVKSFRKPHFINRIAYTFFRSSKARRSYEHAFEYLKRDVNTPVPVAYIEEKTGGLLNRSYYISIYEKDYAVIREQMLGQKIDYHFINELVAFIAQLHEKGVLQKDLSPGNILSKEVDGHYKFILVDINRAAFFDHPLSKKIRYQNFCRLSENQNLINILAKEYARVASLNEKESIKEINRYIKILAD